MTKGRVASCLLLGAVLVASRAHAQPTYPEELERFKAHESVKPRLMLTPGGRLAICGDSITEQRMYSRIIEDYLTMCVPEWRMTVRQYGWSGERAPGFLARMTNDCLRFRPTLATLCYGMNDHEYKPFEDRIGKTYRQNMTAIVRSFKAHDTEVIIGSPGCVGKMPGWVKSAAGTVTDLNLSLCTLRDIDLDIAKKEHVGFADVFWPMITSGTMGQQAFGTNFAIAGKDGVHPGWAGQAVMAYAFLRAMGLDGNLGVLEIDLRRNTCRPAFGHHFLSAGAGEFRFRSSRYPFCACAPADDAAASYPVCAKDNLTDDQSIRAAFTLVPFDEELNRLMLVVKGATAPTYTVTWGMATRIFSKEQLKEGINLAAEFPTNPFSAPFAKVDAAVAAKQAFETKQIKESFRSAEAKTDLTGVVRRTEAERDELAKAIKKAYVPVEHTLKIVAE